MGVFRLSDEKLSVGQQRFGPAIRRPLEGSITSSDNRTVAVTAARLPQRRLRCVTASKDPRSRTGAICIRRWGGAGKEHRRLGQRAHLQRRGWTGALIATFTLLPANLGCSRSSVVLPKVDRGMPFC